MLARSWITLSVWGCSAVSAQVSADVLERSGLAADNVVMLGRHPGSLAGDSAC